MSRSKRLYGTALILVLGISFSFARPSTAAGQIEVEVDPIAYTLNGFSLHVATVLGSTRLSVGTFGIDIPEFFHGNDGWSSSMRGAGAKWDYIGSSLDGWFVGVDGGYMRASYRLEDTVAREKRDVIGLGLRTGYRLPVGGRGLYVSPWASLSYNFNGSDVMIDGQEFDTPSITPFATVHVGWRF